MPVSSPPEQVVRHAARARHNLMVEPVEQLHRRDPAPSSTYGETATWRRAQKAQARDHVPEPGPSIGGAAGNRTRRRNRLELRKR